MFLFALSRFLRRFLTALPVGLFVTFSVLPAVVFAQETVTETTTTTTKTVTRRRFTFNDENVRYRTGNLRLRVGAFVPYREDVRGATSHTHLAGGFSLDLFRARLRKQSFVTELYADATDRAEGGSRLTNVGAGLAFRVYTGPGDADSRGYFGLGGGAYRVRFAVPNSGTDTRFKAGGKAFLGVDTPGGAFLELNWTFLEKERGFDTGGGMVQVGFRL
ncbi:MAG: hypothetical protein SFU56_11575 [Capsulimonadales bacterium]|nr:hypothetical protein [Capsulimonadales bacterium]